MDCARSTSAGRESFDILRLARRVHALHVEVAIADVARQW